MNYNFVLRMYHKLPIYEFNLFSLPVGSMNIIIMLHY